MTFGAPQSNQDPGPGTAGATLVTGANRDCYVGRFAPSPTGPLHFGSLVTALASYLDARSAGGRWLVRMEDIDPPRQVAGATDWILRQLENHRLFWDGDVLYQSSRIEAYQHALEQLQQRGMVYGCDCSRQRVRDLAGIYDGLCQTRELPVAAGMAIRVRVNGNSLIRFEDRIQGHRQQQLQQEVGDFILRRRDGLFAYQLAVVADDHEQGITHIVRGRDLLDSTPRQIYLQRLLGVPQPVYGHIPLVLNPSGQKLSKQNLAAGIAGNKVSANLWMASHWLGMSPPAELQAASADDLITWAVQHWQLSELPESGDRPAPSGYQCSKRG